MSLILTILNARREARKRRHRKLENWVSQVKESQQNVAAEILEIRERLKTPSPGTMVPNNDKEATFYVV